ncbi:MAG: Zn-dependent hydrolase [Fretibacterium sp.]|nr:Zn-dependent hydrolase [Fretibacterium sp.]
MGTDGRFGGAVPPERQISAGFIRARELVEAIAACGRSAEFPDRGVSRLALTEPDRQARELTAKEMRELGMAVRTDACCNLWGVLGGVEKGPGVIIGSHLDSVPEGGDYDGVLGVAAGLGVVRDLLAGQPHPARTLAVVAFTAEESSRFSLATVGSKAAAGRLTPEDAERFRDARGVTLARALRDFGGRPEDLGKEPLSPKDWAAYFELHIEQGPVLDRTGDDVGIVEAIAAPTRFMLELEGVQAHSGACPMDLRHDALAAAAEVILAVEEAGRSEARHGSVATVGVCECHPGAMNVVPGRVVLKVDLRGIRSESVARMRGAVMAKAVSICGARGVACRLTPYSSDEPVAMDTGLTALVEDVCRERGVSHRRMPSGAGHDAMFVAERIPSALIFVPCKDGISHSPKERIEWSRVQAGYEVLREAVKRRLFP